MHGDQDFAHLDSAHCRVAIISTFPPTTCGIATFSEALIRHLIASLGESVCTVHIVALSKTPVKYTDNLVISPAVVSDSVYPSKQVRHLAEFVNRHFSHVIVQHEFGLLPHPYQYVQLLQILDNPVVITVFHTPASYPSVEYQVVMREMSDLSDFAVVMSWRAWHNMISTYDVDENKLVFIPHGVAFETSYLSSSIPRLCSSRHVIFSNGIVHPHKGFERVIRILPRLQAEGFDACFVVAGTVEASHPHAMDEHIALARRLRVSDRFIWIDHFLSETELSGHLRTSTVFAALYDDVIPTSGTVLAAMAHGLPVIATAFRFAKEVLADRRGMLVPFDDDDSTTSAFLHLLASEGDRAAISRRALEFLSSWSWENVSRQYALLISGKRPQPLTPDPFRDEAVVLDSSWAAGENRLFDGSSITFDGHDGTYALYVSSDVQINIMFRGGMLIAAAMQTRRHQLLATVHTVDFEEVRRNDNSFSAEHATYIQGRYFLFSNGPLEVNFSLIRSSPAISLVLRTNIYFYPRGILGHSLRALAEQSYALPEQWNDCLLPTGHLFSTASSVQVSKGSVPTNVFMYAQNPRSISQVLAASPGNKIKSLVIVIEGPFFDQSGFAQVNRRIWFLLKQLGHSIYLQPQKHSYELPTTMTSALLRLAKEAFESQGKIPNYRHITMRNEWPPNFSSPSNGKLIQHLPWEFGAIPAVWVSQLKSATEIWVPSEANAAILRRARVKRPIHVVPHAITFKSGMARKAKRRDGDYVFLFNGGLLPRKGVDILLRAYVQTFKPTDRVVLHIHSTYGEFLLDNIKQLVKNRTVPKIILDRRVLSDQGLAELYAHADALVAPFRGEGFGLPILEGLHAGLHIIVTGAGPANEICWNSCTLIDSSEVDCTIDPCGKKTIFGLRTEWQPSWFEPSEKHLMSLLRHSFIKRIQSRLKSHPKDFGIEALEAKIRERLSYYS